MERERRAEEEEEAAIEAAVEEAEIDAAIAAATQHQQQHASAETEEDEEAMEVADAAAVLLEPPPAEERPPQVTAPLPPLFMQHAEQRLDLGSQQLLARSHAPGTTARCTCRRHVRPSTSRRSGASSRRSPSSRRHLLVRAIVCGCCIAEPGPLWDCYPDPMSGSGPTEERT